MLWRAKHRTFSTFFIWDLWYCDVYTCRLTSWSDRTIEVIVNQVHNFLKFLEVNRHKFFDIETDYEVAPPEYQRRVWSS